MSKPRTAILIPCYRRPEYTNLCLDSVIQAQSYRYVSFYLVDDGSNDETSEILKNYADQIKKYFKSCEVYVFVNKENKGLRNTIIDFFEWVLSRDFKYISKIDNDCMVPSNWLDRLTDLIEEKGADIISPNVSETNAAHKFGRLNKKDGDFIPSEIVGGLWFMRTCMIRDIYFERFNSSGIRAAFNIIHQIVAEKSPKIGWSETIIFEDIGHWGGTHPNHVKSVDHAKYSAEVGRPIAWQPE